MSYQDPSHHLQKDIILKLSAAPFVRFSDLKPAGMESNIFMYHLRQLMSAGMVEKAADGYTLSTNGLSYVDRLSFERRHFREQPKIVSLLRITDAAGSALLWRRKKQPFIGRIDTVQGKLHLGEHVLEAAVRELAEKTGLQDVALTFRGSVYLQYWQDDALLSHILAQIFVGQTAERRPALAPHEHGEAFWGNAQDEPDLMPAYNDISQLLQTQPHIFLHEAVYHLD